MTMDPPKHTEDKTYECMGDCTAHNISCKAECEWLSLINFSLKIKIFLVIYA